jgi:hypothetical protein
MSGQLVEVSDLDLPHPRQTPLKVQDKRYSILLADVPSLTTCNKSGRACTQKPQRGHERLEINSNVSVLRPWAIVEGKLCLVAKIFRLNNN